MADADLVDHFLEQAHHAAAFGEQGFSGADMVFERLPEREKLMMALYYEQELNLREIGEVMGVSESRVCQLHTQAIARLRSQFTGELPAAKQRRKEKSVG